MLTYLKFIITLFFIFNCHQYNTSEHINKIDKYYLNGQFAQALEVARNRTIKSDDKDRLLFLMESGSILHTMEEWEKSNLALLEADELAEMVTTSIKKQILAFVINDKESNFRPESFERVLIKLYIALNYIMLGDNNQALKYFKLLNIELQDIRDIEADYRINHAARYLYAILAESLNLFNQARVQYNNLALFQKYKNISQANLYYLALQEKDLENIKKYQHQGIYLDAYGNQINKISHHELAKQFLKLPKKVMTNYGSLVIIHESGIAPQKISRGKISKDKTFQMFLKSGINTALKLNNKTSLEFSLILATMKDAQNPIPKYIERTKKNQKIIPLIKINQTLVPTLEIFDDYTKMTIKNYNNQYPTYIKKNIVTLSAKIITILAAGKIINSKVRGVNGSILNILTSLIGGKIITETIGPDLRVWNLTYDNLQIKRIILEPGTYQLNLEHGYINYITKYPEFFTIYPNKASFIIIRSY